MSRQGGKVSLSWLRLREWPYSSGFSHCILWTALRGARLGQSVPGCLYTHREDSDPQSPDPDFQSWDQIPRLACTRNSSSSWPGATTFISLSAHSSPSSRSFSAALGHPGHPWWPEGTESCCALLALGWCLHPLPFCTLTFSSEMHLPRCSGLRQCP